MKKAIYIFATMVLGVLLSFLLHAAIEITTINLLMKDFAKYGLGLSWPTWLMIHSIGTAILLLAGVVFGYFIGQRWWKYVYVEKKYRGWRRFRKS